PDGGHVYVPSREGNEITVFQRDKLPGVYTGIAAPGEVIENLNFANFPFGTGSIGDLIFQDDNANGQQDLGESGIADVTLDLYFDLNSNGTIDQTDALLDTQTTDANGNYDFTDWPIGDFIVDVTDDLGILDSLTLISGTVPHTLSLGDQEDYNAADFGFLDQQNGVVIPCGNNT
ncbi:MAG: hypothetical protein GY869_21990, partial [Planctomycetes bacterium]|nr:hypothetical protein [Planctomycetota bacterium]